MKLYAYRDDGWTGGKFRIAFYWGRLGLSATWNIWGRNVRYGLVDTLYDSWRDFRCWFLHGGHDWTPNSMRCPVCKLGFRQMVGLPKWARAQ